MLDTASHTFGSFLKDSTLGMIASRGSSVELGLWVGSC